DDLRDCASGLCLLPELTEEMRAGAESASDIWFQVSGVRQLLLQLRRRDSERLRRAPDQAVALQGVLSSVAAALGSLGPHLAAQAAELEDEIGASRRGLRRELAAEGLWAAHGERAAEDRCDLSDEEDGLMERIGDGPEDFQAELGGLNEQVSKELAQLEQELAELRRKRAGWDDAAHFRFRCILREFQGKNRELITDRLSLEFPHLSREQLQQHEVLCDSLKYATQKQASAFRQWRRERLALLRKHQGRVEERFKAQGAMAARRQDMLEVKEKGKQLQGRLQVQRAKASVKQEEQTRLKDVDEKRRQTVEAEKDKLARQRADEAKGVSRELAEKRREQQQRQAEEATERDRQEADDRVQRLARNAEIVRLRRQMDELKQREVAQQRAAVEQERRERALRLELAMEKLKVQAERDPERLLKVPARALAEAYNDPFVCVTRGPHAGFDENRLMADARYKLSAALQ
ncbi:unnamed protein product, partial [Polarella glacialis]